jgi:hypothetical protein
MLLFLSIGKLFASPLGGNSNERYAYPSNLSPNPVITSAESTVKAPEVNTGRETSKVKKALHKATSVIPAVALYRQMKKISKATVSDAKQGGDWNTLGIVGFSLSMLGIILLFAVGFPFLMGLAGLIVSAIGLGGNNKDKKGKGFAIAGLILGILLVLLFWLIFLLLASLVALAI